MLAFETLLTFSAYYKDMMTKYIQIVNKSFATFVVQLTVNKSAYRIRVAVR